MRHGKSTFIAVLVPIIRYDALWPYVGTTAAAAAVDNSIIAAGRTKDVIGFTMAREDYISYNSYTIYRLQLQFIYSSQFINYTVSGTVCAIELISSIYRTTQDVLWIVTF